VSNKSSSGKSHIILSITDNTDKAKNQQGCRNLSKNIEQFWFNETTQSIFIQQLQNTYSLQVTMELLQNPHVLYHKASLTNLKMISPSELVF
jgi:hypothetical protein